MNWNERYARRDWIKNPLRKKEHGTDAPPEVRHRCYLERKSQGLEGYCDKCRKTRSYVRNPLQPEEHGPNASDQVKRQCYAERQAQGLSGYCEECNTRRNFKNQPLLPEEHGFAAPQTVKEQCQRERKAQGLRGYCKKCNTKNSYITNDKGERGYLEGFPDPNRPGMRFRSQLFKKYYRENFGTKCQGCDGEATDIHHLKGLSNYSKKGEYTFPDDVIGTCRKCHDIMHDNNYTTKKELRSHIQRIVKNHREKFYRRHPDVPRSDITEYTKQVLQSSINTDCNCHGWPKLQCPNTSEAEKQQITNAKRPNSLESISDHHKKLHDIADAIFGDF